MTPEETSAANQDRQQFRHRDGPVDVTGAKPIVVQPTLSGLWGSLSPLLKQELASPPVGTAFS